MQQPQPSTDDYVWHAAQQSDDLLQGIADGVRQLQSRGRDAGALAQVVNAWRQAVPQRTITLPPRLTSSAHSAWAQLLQSSAQPVRDALVDLWLALASRVRGQRGPAADALHAGMADAARAFVKLQGQQQGGGGGTGGPGPGPGPAAAAGQKEEEEGELEVWRRLDVASCGPDEVVRDAQHATDLFRCRARELDVLMMTREEIQRQVRRVLDDRAWLLLQDEQRLLSAETWRQLRDAVEAVRNAQPHERAARAAQLQSLAHASAADELRGAMARMAATVQEAVKAMQGAASSMAVMRALRQVLDVMEWTLLRVWQIDVRKMPLVVMLPTRRPLQQGGAQGQTTGVGPAPAAAAPVVSQAARLGSGSKAPRDKAWHEPVRDDVEGAWLGVRRDLTEAIITYEASDAYLKLSADAQAGIQDLIERIRFALPKLDPRMKALPERGRDLQQVAAHRELFKRTAERALARGLGMEAPDVEPGLPQLDRASADATAGLLMALKTLRLGLQVGALVLAHRAYSQLHTSVVVGEGRRAPPPLRRMLLLALGLDAFVQLLIILLLAVVSAAFSRWQAEQGSGSGSGIFIIDGDFLSTYLVEYFASTTLLLTLGLLIARVIERKRYFALREDGYIASQAYRDMLVGVCGAVYLVPFHLLF